MKMKNKRARNPGKGEDLGSDYTWVLQSQRVDPQERLEDAKYDMDNSGDGLGTRHAYFEKAQEMKEVLSRSSSWDLEGSNKDR